MRTLLQSAILSARDHFYISVDSESHEEQGGTKILFIGAMMAVMVKQKEKDKGCIFGPS